MAVGHGCNDGHEHDHGAEQGDEDLHGAFVSGTGHIFCMQGIRTVYSIMTHYVTGIGTNGSLFESGTLTCPPGSYAFATTGQSGRSVDRVAGLKCRNIYNGAESMASGNGFGGGGGKAAKYPVDCGGNALTGFATISNTNLDGFGGRCRAATCGGGSCGQAVTEAGLSGSDGRRNTQIGDASHLVNSVWGNRSNNNVVANFGWSALNFDVMRGAVPGGRYEAWGAACCARNEGGAECQSARNGGLNCTDVMQNWCKQGDRVFTDPTCTGGALDGTWARNQQMTWCQQGSNFNSDNCKAFCTASTGNGTAQKEGCNQLYAAKCSDPANKGLDICSCSLAWSDYPTDITAIINKIGGAPREPMCYFSQCAQKGYLKTTKDKLACPACIQNQSININNSTASVKDISQSCNVSLDTGKTTAATNTAANSTPSGGTNSSTTGGSTVTPTPTPAPTPPTPSAPTPSTPTPTTPTASKTTSPLIFVGAGVTGFLVLTVIAVAVSK